MLPVSRVSTINTTAVLDSCSTGHEQGLMISMPSEAKQSYFVECPIKLWWDLKLFIGMAALAAIQYIVAHGTQDVDQCIMNSIFHVTFYYSKHSKNRIVNYVL